MSVYYRVYIHIAHTYIALCFVLSTTTITYYQNYGYILYKYKKKSKHKAINPITKITKPISASKENTPNNN
jgi:hypothetical protein